MVNTVDATQADDAPRQQDMQALKRQIGERLALARQEKKLDKVDAAGELRITSTYIDALEAGDWSSLPGEVYALGFLRQYADMLGIDISDDINQLKSTDYHLTKPFTMPDPPIAPHKKWAITAAVAFVALMIFFNVKQSDDGPPRVDQRPPQQQAVQQAELNDTSNAEMVAAAPPAAEPVPAPAPMPAPATAPPPEVLDDSATAPEQHEFIFSAQGNSVWIQIFDADRQLLKEALLRPGETIRIQSMTKLYVTSGNAAALQISMDGEVWAAAGSLGGENQVRRWLEVWSG
jgi:cytoskeleton protein RodZ